MYWVVPVSKHWTKDPTNFSIRALSVKLLLFFCNAYVYVHIIYLNMNTFHDSSDSGGWKKEARPWGPQNRSLDWLDAVPNVPYLVYTRGHVEPDRPNFVYIPGVRHVTNFGVFKERTGSMLFAVCAIFGRFQSGRKVISILLKPTSSFGVSHSFHP